MTHVYGQYHGFRDASNADVDVAIMLVLYDIPSKLESKIWSPNTMKIRYVPAIENACGYLDVSPGWY